jgi:hypothetical protein
MPPIAIARRFVANGGLATIYITGSALSAALQRLCSLAIA